MSSIYYLQIKNYNFLKKLCMLEHSPLKVIYG